MCARPQARGLTCARCRSHTPLTGVISAGSYRSAVLQRGIHWLKFKRLREVAPHLAYFLLPRLAAIGPLSQLQATAAFVPIPLHPRREKERGFNQAHALAAALSHFTRIPLLPAITRTRATYWQSHLPQELRAQNVAEAFAVQDGPLHFQTLLLVDDVTTSGATLSAAAAALASSTHAHIWGVTIARG